MNPVTQEKGYIQKKVRDPVVLPGRSEKSLPAWDSRNQGRKEPGLPGQGQKIFKKRKKKWDEQQRRRCFWAPNMTACSLTLLSSGGGALPILLNLDSLVTALTNRGGRSDAKWCLRLGHKKPFGFPCVHWAALGLPCCEEAQAARREHVPGDSRGCTQSSSPLHAQTRRRCKACR